MKRMRALFALPLLILAIPAWRLMDWLHVILPFKTLTTFAFIFWGACFLLLPLRLLAPKFNRWMAILFLISLGLTSWFTGTQSGMAVLEPNQVHCSRSSYTGVFYPLRGLLTPAHQDDLEAKNQMCWLVKMIRKVPSEVLPEDLAHELNLMKFKMMKPTLKYRASLPWIGFILGKYLTSTEVQNGPLLVQYLGFWSNLYNEEISARVYPWYDQPFAVLTQFEYGLIEKNWENIKLEVIE